MDEDTPLSLPDIKLLEEQEAIIQNDAKAFVRAGTALCVIRDKRLYRASYSSFDQYCREKWGFTRFRAAQLIDASSLVSAISDENCRQIVTSEGAARELLDVPTRQLNSVIKEAAKDAPTANGTPILTAKRVREVVERRTPKPKTPKPEKNPAPDPDAPPVTPDPVDVNGTPLPNRKPIREAFAEADKFDDLMKRITQIKADVSRIAEPARYHLNHRQLEADLSNARTAVKFGRPYAVCPYCKGAGKHHGSACRGCGESGWVNKSIYDSAPSEMQVAGAGE